MIYQLIKAEITAYIKTVYTKATANILAILRFFMKPSFGYLSLSRFGHGFQGIIFILLLMTLNLFGQVSEQPPFEVPDPSLSENFNQIYYAIDNLPIKEEDEVVCIDDPTFCVDKNSDEVGIGSNDPDSKIELKQDGDDYLDGMKIEKSDTDDSYEYHVDESTRLVIGFANDASGSDAAGDYTEYWALAAIGAITQPLQPSFLAYNSATDANVTGDGTAFTVEYDSEVFDQNDDFDTTNDQFVAPVDGVYQFNITVRVDDLPADVEYCLVYMNTSNRLFRTIAEASIAEVAGRGIVYATLADMDENDTAYVRVQCLTGTKQIDVLGNNSNPSTSPITFFSGSLFN